MIAKETEAEVVRLYHGEQWPIGTIAAQLGLHYTTVQRVLQQTGVDAKIVAPRASIVDPFVPFIVEQLHKYPGLRSTRVFAMLKERGYRGGPDHIRRVVGRLRPKKPAEAFRRLRTMPGEQAQVDWAHFGKLQIGRALRPLWGFVMVLSYSRRIFLRFFPSAAMHCFIRGHVEAFTEFGGVPRTLLYDNLKSAVLERRRDAIRFNPMLLALSAHYRFEARPVAVARGNEKGRVERAIRYVREAFFAARAYVDLADINRQAAAWTASEAVERSWVEDRSRTVHEAFQEEQGVFRPLPNDPFPADERVEVEVGKTPYVRFDLNDYSIPHDRTQRTVVVFADLDQLRLVEGTTIIATHRRCWDRGQQIEHTEHVERLTAEKRRLREHRGLDRLARAARSSSAFLRIIAERHQNVGNATARLVQILDAVGPAELEEALVEALERDTIHVGAVRQIVDRRRSERGLPPPVSIPVAHSQHADLVVTPHSLDTYDALRKEKLS